MAAACSFPNPIAVSENITQQGCTSYLWGGTGVPSYDDAGSCSCSCEENWRRVNVIGHACCVPRTAHVVFTYAGLGFSLVQLIHAAYGLHQQRLSEALRRARGKNVKMLVEVYREQLSIITIIHAPIIGLYFALTLWLPEEGVEWCAMVLGVSHCLSGIGATLTVQVLIRSVDPRLLKKGALVLRVSAGLTHPVGRFLSFSAVSIGGLILVYLASKSMTGKGYEIAAKSYILVTAIRIVVITTCSWSMVQMINKSMRQQAGKQRTDVASGGGTARGAITVATKVDPKLVMAKRTILSALFFCVSVTSIASTALLYALATPRGIENPLVFLATPLAFGPMMAMTFHIHLHSKRNRGTARGSRSPTTPVGSAKGVSSTGGGVGDRKKTNASFTASFSGGRSARKAASGRVVAAETGEGEE
ncbi:unnamed protein product, partial [Hapterophycus canaliculatus]